MQRESGARTEADGQMKGLEHTHLPHSSVVTWVNRLSFYIHYFNTGQRNLQLIFMKLN